ncbi:MAG: SGNH/GDSL hydrolase family protein [Chthoniobacteraceae bacterium]
MNLSTALSVLLIRPVLAGLNRRLLIMAILCLSGIFGRAATPLSVRQFDEKARRGKPVSVVFFGGSLTWGANASDPQVTSYRGRMMRYLTEKYPRTPIRFYDGSIGGTGSALGLFRLQRDVLSHQPDLVFLDFTVNDDAAGTDVESLASYERIVRDILGSGSGLLEVLMAFREHATDPAAPVPPRHQNHLKLAHAYHLPVANILDYLRGLASAGKLDPAAIWSINRDGAHPGDEGYAIFFEAVKTAYEKAITDGALPVIPKATVFPDLYPKYQRTVLVDGALPKGWKRQKTYRTSLWFDGLSSRWMGDVAVAAAKDTPEPIECKFAGSMVGIFGERNGYTPPIRVFVDGKPVAAPKASAGDFLWKLDTSRFAPPRNGSGQLFLWLKLADVPDGEHTLRIEPVFESAGAEAELRIESICSAGR